MAPPPSPLESALAALADRSPAELSRVPTLRAAHAACAAAGVFDGGAASASASAAAHAASAAGDGAVDVAKLHQIFDAAVHHGMPQLVCHYVDEVCGHDDFSSPDGVEAYLQDGEMVAEWAVAALASAAVVLEQAAALRVPSAAADVDRAGAVFEALRDVLCALGASPSAGGERGAGASSAGAGARDPARGFQSRLQSALDDATRRAQHARALAWALREGLCGASVSDRHGGPAAWAGSVAARRASAAAAAAASNLPPPVDAGALFLDDLLAGVGDRPPSYPFKSAAEAAERVFAEGSAAPAALVAKQCLFLYYLLDAGAAFDAAPPARFARAARMSPRLVAETRAAALLDDRERVEALDEACALVPRVAHPGLAARFVAALVSRGRPGAALATARARSDEEANASSEEANASSEEYATWEDESSCAEAELGVSVRLECGLATEAFLAARGATRRRRDAREKTPSRAPSSLAWRRTPLKTGLWNPSSNFLSKTNSSARSSRGWRRTAGRRPARPRTSPRRIFSPEDARRRRRRRRRASPADSPASRATSPPRSKPRRGRFPKRRDDSRSTARRRRRRRRRRDGRRRRARCRWTPPRLRISRERRRASPSPRRRHPPRGYSALSRERTDTSRFSPRRSPRRCHPRRAPRRSASRL